MKKRGLCIALCLCLLFYMMHGQTQQRVAVSLHDSFDFLL